MFSFQRGILLEANECVWKEGKEKTLQNQFAASIRDPNSCAKKGFC